MSEYRIINICFSGIIGLMFVYTAFFYDSNSAMKCQVKLRTGKDCISCGFTRDFHAYTNGTFDEAINPHSFSIFLFFATQLLFRGALAIFNPSKKWLTYTDITFTLIAFVYAFYPLIVHLKG